MGLQEWTQRVGLLNSAIGAGAKRLCRHADVCVCVRVLLSSGEIINLHKSRRYKQKLSDLKNGKGGEVLIPVEGYTFFCLFWSSRYSLWKCEIFKMLETVLTVCIGAKPGSRVYDAADGVLPWSFEAVGAWARYGRLWCVTVFWLGGVKRPRWFRSGKLCVTLCCGNRSRDASAGSCFRSYWPSFVLIITLYSPS